MAYLESKEIIHRDLAARNLLVEVVADGYRVKIRYIKLMFKVINTKVTLDLLELYLKAIILLLIKIFPSGNSREFVSEPLDGLHLKFYRLELQLRK